MAKSRTATADGRYHADVHVSASTGENRVVTELDTAHGFRFFSDLRGTRANHADRVKLKERRGGVAARLQNYLTHTTF